MLLSVTGAKNSLPFFTPKCLLLCLLWTLTLMSGMLTKLLSKSQVKSITFGLSLTVKQGFVLGFHLSPHRDSPQAFSLFDSVEQYGKPNAIVTDRYSAYKVPTKSIFDVPHIRVVSFKDDISNNVIEAFNKQFKYWYKTRYGFNSFESANSMIMMFVFFYNFIRPHSSLSNLTPAQVAGLKYSKRQQNSLLLVSWFSLS